ncbi:hypothetical protein [Rhodococcus sp. ACT016]|uniref:hypothetical protein n=1 Tax=Rhodococcus sp. ACT016 TaxID=3134808 RepID=UPI003D2BF100
MAETEIETPGEVIERVFTAKAREAGFEFDEDDLIVLALAAQTAEDIGALDRSIATKGAVIGSEANPKPNPALTEVRQQRLALGRLMADLDRRLGIAAQGGSSGFRGRYDGDGSQNQQRDATRARQRGQGRQARPGALRGA